MNDETDKLSEQEIDQFVAQALKAREVWALQYPDGGFAICPSNDFDEVDVYVVWSNEADAKACCEDDWKNLVPVAIDLDEFVEDWLPGMYEDGLLVGPDWDSELAGPEIAALELAKRFGGGVN